ncbi:MAG: pilus assembly protein [Planctomycetes bacterium]|nr:pilus assembly protein [Planctomycetota bacterium]
MDAKRNVWKNEEGQAVVEAAITLPIFLFLLCGIFELSYMFVVQAMVDYSAYCAARCGIVRNGDTEMMKWAAAQALAPVTQTAIPLPGPLTLRTEYTGPVSIATGHLVHWGASMVARAQFEVQLPRQPRYGSKKEYIVEAYSLGGLNMTLDSLTTKQQAVGAIGASGSRVKTRTKLEGVQDPVFTINDMRILDPDDFNRNPQDPNKVQGTSQGHTYMSIRQFWAGQNNGLRENRRYLLAREPRATEFGETGTGAPYEWNQFLGDGLRMGSSNAAVIKKMRLRVEIIHSHKLLFKFLVPVVAFMPMPQPKYWAFWSTGVDPGVRSKMYRDELYRNAAGRVLIRGEWTMRMQSHFMEKVPTRSSRGRSPQ